MAALLILSLLFGGAAAKPAENPAQTAAQSETTGCIFLLLFLLCRGSVILINRGSCF